MDEGSAAGASPLRRCGEPISSHIVNIGLANGPPLMDYCRPVFRPGLRLSSAVPIREIGQFTGRLG
jgi:hypothetical protein